MDVVSVVDEGLGHASYVVDLGDGTALVVDPARLPVRQRAVAAARGLRVAWTADTHSHADYVSGSPELAAGGAMMLAPADAHLVVEHRGLRDREHVVLGRYVLEALATPGHTPEHQAYLLRDDAGRPVGLFSGGSLMVGAVGRTDLLGLARAEELARAMFHALRDRLLVLPDELPVFPTHGAGSFCSAPAAADRTTTIGRERASNAMLQIDDEDRFVDELLRGLGSFPSYFRRLPELNRRGPRLYVEAPRLDRLSLEAFRSAVEAGAQVIDTRPLRSFAEAHVPGALAIELRPVFATWLGWLVDPQRPVLFVVGDDQDRDEIVRQALTIGVESLAGELDSAMTTWQHAGLDVASIPLVDAGEITGAVLDVRQDNEYAAGHLPGAHHVELGALSDAVLPFEPLTVMCGHGERAMTAASLLARAGRADLRVAFGGPDDWSRTTGTPLATT
jgi:glyoxylase-like metal-dependent hydrolase (beta-lactamase superfamily II)/rhodanese-related sulfurtransferase